MFWNVVGNVVLAVVTAVFLTAIFELVYYEILMPVIYKLFPKLKENETRKYGDPTFLLALSIFCIVCFYLHDLNQQQELFDEWSTKQSEELYQEAFTDGVAEAMQYIQDEYQYYDGIYFSADEILDECWRREDFENVLYGLEEAFYYFTNDIDELLSIDGYDLAERLLDPPPVKTPAPTENANDDNFMQDTPNSSCFSQVGYDTDEERLIVEFRETKAVYEYTGFSAADWDAFISADSLGTYFNKYIKGNYTFSRVD